MPVLLVILGQKLGLPVTLAIAPQHVLVKYRADSGEWLNVEATHGGFKYDTRYERELAITPLAIEKGIYLRPLGRRESVAAMLGTLMEFYGHRGREHDRLAVADLVLAVDPEQIDAIAHKGAAYYKLLETRFMRRYPTPGLIPEAERAEYDHLGRENLAWYAKADALGWTPPMTPEQQAAYLETIRLEKQAQARKTTPPENPQ